MGGFLDMILSALGSGTGGGGGATAGGVGGAASDAGTGGGDMGGILGKVQDMSPGLEQYKKQGGGLSGIGGVLGGPAGAGIGSMAEDVMKTLMLMKADKMAREHAGWLQNIAANPPRPGWARSMSGPGMNS